MLMIYNDSSDQLKIEDGRSTIEKFYPPLSILNPRP